MLQYYLHKYGPFAAILAVVFVFGILVRGCNDNTAEAGRMIREWEIRFDSLERENKTILQENLIIKNRIQERNSLIRGLEDEIFKLRNEKDSISIHYSGVLDSVNDYTVSELQKFFTDRYGNNVD